MELSRTVGSTAIVLAIILVAGHALGEATSGSTAPTPTVQQKVEEREAQRRSAIEEQQRRKEAYQRACQRPLRTEAEVDLCRAAYKRLESGKL